ncbi:MAG TPA: LysR family transcriptional regulator [Vicinamibacterales bacterium]|nr:LysR family transcriptional regulator [Vicinamibacterales bacterium]
MDTLSIRHLQLITTLHETGTATAAAARLGVTQSAVSHQLREIEARLNAPVCVRAGRRLILTPAGMRLLETARVVMAELERTARDVRRLADGHAGTLRITAQCHTGYHWLPPLLRTFRARYPGVDVEVAVEHTRHPVEALLQGSLDVALVTDTVRDKRLRVRRLAADEHVAIVSRTHPWTKKSFITPAELGSEDLLLYSASPAESFTVRRILAPAGVRPARVRFVQLTEALVEMVKAGLGVSVLPMWAVRPAVTRGDIRTVRITRRGIQREWSAVTLKNANEPLYLSEFIALVHKTIGGLAPG